MTPRLRDAEHRFVDAESNHRPNEVRVLLERILVDLQAITFQLLAEVGDHRVVDEVRLHRLTAGRRAADARIAFRTELLRVALERLAGPERAAKPGRVESFE